MEMTIKVEIGVTRELGELARSLFAGRRSAVISTGAEEAPAEETRQCAEAAAGDSEQTSAAPAAEETRQTAPVKQAKASYTEEDVREAMHQCRLRIEGPDYKSDTTTPGYTRYHRALTVRFKELAQLIGYDKPSTLPAEHRKDFIDRCANIIVGDDGELTNNNPF